MLLFSLAPVKFEMGPFSPQKRQPTFLILCLEKNNFLGWPVCPVQSQARAHYWQQTSGPDRGSSSLGSGQKRGALSLPLHCHIWQLIS